jgi:hypothetical protein
MDHRSWRHVFLGASALFLSIVALGCGGARDETVAGVVVPVPRAMERASGQGIEVSLPGFGGGQASFHGSMSAEEIVVFYKKEMPARGWQAGTSLVSRSGMLTYTKEGKSVLLAIGAQDNKSTLSITVGSVGKS